MEKPANIKAFQSVISLKVQMFSKNKKKARLGRGVCDTAG